MVLDMRRGLICLDVWISAILFWSIQPFLGFTLVANFSLILTLVDMNIVGFLSQDFQAY